MKDLGDFMDESRAPKNPRRKILGEHEERIKEIVRKNKEKKLKKSKLSLRRP
jgi:hypothetical protein